MLGFYIAFFELIGAHAVYAAHHDVTKDYSISRPGDELEIELEARILLKSGHIDRDNGNLAHAGFCQCPADKTDVVGGTAAAAGLGHQNRGPVQIIFTGVKCLHDLSHHEEGRITGVVIDILEAEIDCPAIIVGQDHEIVAAGTHSRFEKVEMDR